jgi:hypothetical protein
MMQIQTCVFKMRTCVQNTNLYVENANLCVENANLNFGGYCTPCFRQNYFIVEIEHL